MERKEEKKEFFKVVSFEVIVKSKDNGSVFDSLSSANIKLLISGQFIKHEVAEGNGPVNALSNALCKALSYFDCLEKLKLVNYNVRIVNNEKGTASSVKVKISFIDEEGGYNAESTSTDIISASLQALVEGFNWKIGKHVDKIFAD